MKITLFTVSLLVSVASGRRFTLYDDANYGGASHTETRDTDKACWNLNGKGDRASSVKGAALCTTFYRERDCKGANWQQEGNAATVPGFLNDHIWSFRNQCCNGGAQSKCILACNTSCAAAGPQGMGACVEGCTAGCDRAWGCS